MELSAVGERVFAAESIIKRRIRRVRVPFFDKNVSLFENVFLNACVCKRVLDITASNTSYTASAAAAGSELTTNKCFSSLACAMAQGRMEYLVKWKGWSQK